MSCVQVPVKTLRPAAVGAGLAGLCTETMSLARVRTDEFAVRASYALAANVGSSSVIKGSIAERIGRDEQVLQTFGSRPAIRDTLLEVFVVARTSSLRAPKVWCIER